MKFSVLKRISIRHVSYQYIFPDFIDLSGLELPHYHGMTITLRHTTIGTTPLDEWSCPSHRPLRDNSQHPQQTDVHAPGGIWTQNFSNRAAADSHLRRRSQRDRLLVNYKRNPEHRGLQNTNTKNLSYDFQSSGTCEAYGHDLHIIVHGTYSLHGAESFLRS